MRSSLLLLAAAWIFAASTLLGLDKPQEYRRPELVAITWQQSYRPGGVTVPLQLWGPDGTLLDEVETQWLLADLGTFNIHEWSTNSELRPLVLVFWIDEPAKAPQTLMAGLHDGSQFRPTGSARRSTSHHLAITSVAPQCSELAAWPSDVDIQVRVPVAEPEVINSFGRQPDHPLQIAPGVRWSIDQKGELRSTSGKRQAVRSIFARHVGRRQHCSARAIAEPGGCSHFCRPEWRLFWGLAEPDVQISFVLDELLRVRVPPRLPRERVLHKERPLQALTPRVVTPVNIIQSSQSISCLVSFSSAPTPQQGLRTQSRDERAMIYIAMINLMSRRLAKQIRV